MADELSDDGAAAVLGKVRSAVSAGKLSDKAARNIERWLVEPRYAAYRGQIAEHVAHGKWRELHDAFWTVLEFGTGGRRGRMYPIGCNCINDETIGESAQGLASYVLANRDESTRPACAVAYDTRHQSRHFAELCSEVMAANGLEVYFLHGYRSTPELSFAVRYLKCACGLMVTASHNPPTDNAVKAYWSSGAQLLPPHDKPIVAEVEAVREIRRMPFAQAVAAGRVVFCQADVDAAYLESVRRESRPGPRDVRIVYSPMHGVGASSVMPALAAAGFTDVELFGPHAAPDGDFPNVPDHVANPENPATFERLIARAREIGADVVLSTDPDADRLGCAAPVAAGGAWQTFTGNQLGALLADYALARRRDEGQFRRGDYVVKTLVTTELVRRIADHYGARTLGELHVGFKWIAEAIDKAGPEGFVFGAEESHGYLIGTYARDKDAAVAAVLAAELAARCKSQGRTLHHQLDALYLRHGVHLERTISKTMPGEDGMLRMKALLARWREKPPHSLAGLAITQIRDYGQKLLRVPGRSPAPLDVPKGEMLIVDLEHPGNYVAIRPSGTEPKVKFYMFTFEPPGDLAQFAPTRQALARRLDALEVDVAAFADAS